jgi:N-acetylglucosaminyl-diphospho-decaprenol L-rhamnosyltransferase
VIVLDISIVIINWNTKEFLAQCLQSVHKAGEGLESEVLVVDNASTDGSAAMVQERFSWVQLVENERNVGFARANNQAIVLSRGQYVLLLNSDTEVHQGALETLVQFMEAHPQVGGCGPRLLNPDGSLQSSCHPMLTPWREFWRLMFLDRLWRRATYVQERWDQKTPRRVEVIKGACLLLRRDALNEVGLLDEQYFLYTEEMDLCYRLAQAGWELWWVPRAMVRHHGQASAEQMAEAMYVQLYRSKVQFHRKYGSNRRARAFKILLALAYFLRWILAPAGQVFAPGLKPRAQTYRRLLTSLPDM